MADGGENERASIVGRSPPHVESTLRGTSTKAPASTERTTPSEIFMSETNPL
jgi:hypothetical protein